MDTGALDEPVRAWARERGVRVRTLPDSPSLEYLRRQAKDLLVGMRATRAQATLSDAQVALARQYGFHTWTQLKAEVERRRGRSELAEPALAQCIATRFGLGTVTAPMRSLAPANEVGRPWALDTDRGRWAVKQVTGWYGIDDIVEHAETDVRLQEAALAAGVLLPRPVRSVTGAVVECVDGRNWRVNAWIEAGPPLSAPVSAAIARQAGALLARLHALALAPDRPMEAWYRPIKTADDWAALAVRASALNLEWASAFGQLQDKIADLTHMAL